MVKWAAAWQNQQSGMWHRLAMTCDCGITLHSFHYFKTKLLSTGFCLSFYFELFIWLGRKPWIRNLQRVLQSKTTTLIQHQEEGPTIEKLQHFTHRQTNSQATISILSLSGLTTMQNKTKRNRLMTKPTKWHVRPAKTQISLGIRPVWSESSLCAQWMTTKTDQTGRMPRLIWVFAGRIPTLLVLSWGGSTNTTHKTQTIRIVKHKHLLELDQY